MLNSKNPKLRDLLNIEYLESNRAYLKHISPIDKKKLKILFVDDEGFDTEQLIRLGYLDVHKMYEYQKMIDFEPYDMIFCDINGIARDLDEVYQGAALAKLIKETYPDKIVVIFSAKQQYLSFNKFYNSVDDIILKNITTTELVERINHYIYKQTDPVEFWKMLRNQLLDQNTSSKVIAELEHFFVLSIIEDKDYTKNIQNVTADVDYNKIANVVNVIINFIRLYLERSS